MSLALEKHTQLATHVCFAAKIDDSELKELGAEDRWRAYRNMVRARLKKVVRAALPRTTRALGEDLQPFFVAWLDKAPPTTRYFRSVPEQFVDFALADLAADARLWLGDLARYEIETWRTKYADERDAPETVELSFERQLVIHPSVALLELGHSVHRKHNDKARDYEKAEHRLCIYRDAEHKAVTMELNALAHALMAQWLSGDGQSLAQSTKTVAERRDTRVDEKFIDGLSTLLEDFINRGIVMGSKA